MWFAAADVAVLIAILSRIVSKSILAWETVEAQTRAALRHLSILGMAPPMLERVRAFHLYRIDHAQLLSQEALLDAAPRWLRDEARVQIHEARLRTALSCAHHLADPPRGLIKALASELTLQWCAPDETVVRNGDEATCAAYLIVHGAFDCDGQTLSAEAGGVFGCEALAAGRSVHDATVTSLGHGLVYALPLRRSRVFLCDYSLQHSVLSTSCSPSRFTA